MDQGTPHDWSTSPAGGGDEFSTFLDFDDVDLTFHGGGSADPNLSTSEDIMDMSASSFAHDVNQSQLSAPASVGFPSGDPLSDNIQRNLYRHQVQPSNELPRGVLDYVQTHDQKERHGNYYRHGMVPPTPNSSELQGSHTHNYTDPQALGMYEAGKHQEQMVFTPLVSPAFQLHEFNTSGEYFSPLTSPALQAQDYGRSVGLSTTVGDIERRDLQNHGVSAKKTKRRSAAGGRDPVHSIRSSPAMKARQKRHSGGGKTPKEVAEIVAGLGTLKQASPRIGSDNRIATHRSHASSETGSISPEPLSDVLMPPPAVPRLNGGGRTDHQSPQHFPADSPLQTGPATPASLFRIAKPSVEKHENSEASTRNSILSNLPATPANPEPDSDPSAKDHSSTDDCSASNKRGSEDDVLIDRITVASSVITSGNQGRSSSIAARDPSIHPQSIRKKSSSSQASPALRPRISPSIKPLLPGGTGYDSEATAALLANKSNYERIIDGSASQFGVTFPAQLSENLTSKRTSHKLAEQGRRNRINTALSEIQSLLPEGFGRDVAEPVGSNAGSSANNNGASKAKTVENAIAYIKQLRTELARTKAELAAVQKSSSRQIIEDVNKSNI